MLANHVYAHLLLLLQPSVLWLSIVTFNNYVKPPGAKVNFARIWCITNPTPTSLGYLTLKRWHGKIWPQLRGLPGVSDRATHFEGLPHLSCKRDQIKMRDYMDRRVTPCKWVIMPTWGPLLHVKAKKLPWLGTCQKLAGGRGGGNFKFGFGN